MKKSAAILLVGCVMWWVPASSLAQQPTMKSPPDTTAPDIPGVVAGGTKVQLIRDLFQSTEGPIAMPDASLLFTEQDAGDGALVKIDKDGNISMYLENTNRTTGVGVQVFSPQGQHLGTIPTPMPPQAIAFAGSDKKTLYVVGRGAVWKIAMTAQGYLGRAK